MRKVKQMCPAEAHKQHSSTDVIVFKFAGTVEALNVARRAISPLGVYFNRPAIRTYYLHRKGLYACDSL